MKKFITLALAVLFAGTSLLSAQNKTASRNEGVDFKEASLKELTALAAKEDKLLFVDVYAVWCGPCKYMASKVFTQPAAGDYFNAHFINAKFDAEKGEGVEIARKYRVTAYPTFLLLDASGKEVGRIVGGGNIDDFIAKVKETVANIE